jgi:hypothetical protein
MGKDQEYFNKQTKIVELPSKIGEKKEMSEKMKNYIKEKSEKRKELNEINLRDLYILKQLRLSNQIIFLEKIHEIGYKTETEFENAIKNLEKKLKVETETVQESKKEKNLTDEELFEIDLQKNNPKKLLDIFRKKRRKIISDITNIKSKVIYLFI